MDTRALKGINDRVASVLCIATMCFILSYGFGIFNFFGVILMPVAYGALTSGLILVLTIWMLPAIKGTTKIPWYDWVLTVFAIVPAVYIFLFYRKRVVGSMLASPLEIVLAIMMTLAVLETIRRTVGLTVAFITLAFPLYALFASYLPGLLHGPSSSVARTAGYLFLFNDGMFGTTVDVIATIVAPYMLFGQLLFITGVGKFYTNIALVVFGRFKGGAAKSAVVASSLFGTFSLSAISNVATIGIITIPLMKSTGYRSEFAAGVEAVSSTGDLIMPPVMGTVAFIMADYIDVPYASVAVAAAVPAILYYLAVFLQVHLEAVKMGLAAIPKSSLPSFRETITTGWYCLIPMLVLIYSLMIQRMDAVEAVGFAMLAAVLIGFLKKETRPTPQRLADSFKKTTPLLIFIFPICVGAGLLTGGIGLTGLGIRLSQMLITLSGNNIVVLVILAAIICFIMGTAMAMIPTYIILAVLVAPAMVSMGLNIMAVHLFIMYMAILAIITPPVAGAAFAAASIAGSDPMASGWIACRLGIVAYVVPFMFVFNPAVILLGTPGDIVIGVIFSAIATVALATGLEGFLFDRTNLVQRGMLLIGGLCFITLSWYLRGAGLVLVSAAILWQWLEKRATPSRLTGLGG